MQSEIKPFPLALTGADPIAYTEREGGDWIPKPLWDQLHTNKSPAAEMYADGSIYDYVLEKHYKDMGHSLNGLRFP